MILTQDGLLEYVRAETLGNIADRNGGVIVYGPDEAAYYITDVVIEAAAPAVKEIFKIGSDAPKKMVLSTGTPGAVRIDGAKADPNWRAPSARRTRGLRTSFRVPVGSPVPIVRSKKGKP